MTLSVKCDRACGKCDENYVCNYYERKKSSFGSTLAIVGGEFDSCHRFGVAVGSRGLCGYDVLNARWMSESLSVIVRASTEYTSTGKYYHITR